MKKPLNIEPSVRAQQVLDQVQALTTADDLDSTTVDNDIRELRLLHDRYSAMVAIRDGMRYHTRMLHSERPAYMTHLVKTVEHFNHDQFVIEAEYEGDHRAKYYTRVDPFNDFVGVHLCKVDGFEATYNKDSNRTKFKFTITTK